MRELAITITPETTTATLLASLADGTAQLHTERSNGTFRRVHFLAPDTEARNTAEWVLAMREGNEEEDRAPRTMASIAKEINASIPTVRRMINDLLLTHELEDMDAADLDELLHGGQEVEDTMVVTTDQDGETSN